jgi:hypothetical protein
MRVLFFTAASIAAIASIGSAIKLEEPSYAQLSAFEDAKPAEATKPADKKPTPAAKPEEKKPAPTQKPEEKKPAPATQKPADKGEPAKVLSATATAGNGGVESVMKELKTAVQADAQKATNQQMATTVMNHVNQQTADVKKEVADKN